MDKQKRNVIIFIIIAVLLVCLVGAALLVGAGVFLYRRYATQAQTQTVVSTASPVEPGSQLETEMNQIEAQVSQERGLSLPGPIERDFLTSDQLAQTVSEEFFKDYTPEEAVQDARSLYLLGLLPKDFDLLTFYKQLYSEQIAGYYDNEEQAMYVVSDSAFSGWNAVHMRTNLSTPCRTRPLILKMACVTLTRNASTIANGAPRCKP